MMRISVLNIRQAAGSGGGADAVILNTLKRMDRSAFDAATLYIKKYGDDITPIRMDIETLGLPFFEDAGMKFFDPLQLARIVGLIRRLDAGIVHTHDPKSDFYGYLARRLIPGVKLIATLHGWSTMTRKGGLYKAIDLFALRSFDAVIAVSGVTAGYAARRGIGNVRVIRNSIDLDEWSPLDAVDRGEGFRVGFVGRLSREKAPLDFLKVAKAVLEKSPGIEFHIAGEGPEKDAVEEFIGKADMARSVRLLGQLSKDEVKRLYARLDLVLLTSHTEGLPITLLEAMAMGVPVVATRVGGVEELVTHGQDGLLAGAGDIGRMAEHVVKLKQDRAYAKTLGRNARARVESVFSLRDNVRKLEDVYRELCPF